MQKMINPLWGNVKTEGEEDIINLNEKSLSY